ncbi:MAG: Mn2+ dependent serine/threonine protein kinase [Actinomycetia bacterium]|nr:Mn2+ dependent serine/threonine protein kinase [Actinomycetes bacterium]
MRPPGKLLASGRDADIFECGPGLVLRRARSGRSLAEEARTMAYARDQGYPVPAVEELSDDGSELVMERIDGVSMVDALTRRPWTLWKQGAVLADLHRRLHDIPAPDWVPPAFTGDGDQLLHLDLHPLNVMVTATGPVVIDWPRAARGDGGVDVAITWLLMAAATVPSRGIEALVQGRFRRMLIDAFVRGVDVDGARRHLPAVAEWKCEDENMSPVERDAMRAFAAKAAPS